MQEKVVLLAVLLTAVVSSAGCPKSTPSACELLRDDVKRLCGASPVVENCDDIRKVAEADVEPSCVVMQNTVRQMEKSAKEKQK